jgi:cobalamin synthase
MLVRLARLKALTQEPVGRAIVFCGLPTPRSGAAFSVAALDEKSVRAGLEARATKPCDNQPSMWFVLIAALLAALMLIQSVGVEPAIVLVVATIIGMIAWRAYRRRHPAAPPTNYCLKCGATLPVTARSCRDCGSAAWSSRQ